jgi:hypothetical protein
VLEIVEHPRPVKLGPDFFSTSRPSPGQKLDAVSSRPGGDAAGFVRKM